MTSWHLMSDVSSGGGGAIMISRASVDTSPEIQTHYTPVTTWETEWVTNWKRKVIFSLYDPAAKSAGSVISHFSARHQSERKNTIFNSKMNVCWGKRQYFKTVQISFLEETLCLRVSVRKQETGFLKIFEKSFFRFIWSVRLKKELIISHYVSKS